MMAKLLIGIAFMVVSAVVTALTAGAGTGFLAAFGSALISSTIQVGISTAISAGIGMVVGGITTGTWQGALNGLLNGAADGFMWGGIFAGGAQIFCGGFKVAANLGVATGRNGGIQLTKNLKILSPNNVKFYENGGTLLKIGKNFRLDVGAKTMLHMHMLGAEHIPIGTILASFLGSYKSLWQK